MAVFVNATAHELLPQQIEEAKKNLGCEEFLELKVWDTDLYKRLINCPSDVDALQDLAVELINVIEDIMDETDEEVYVHLPIGSPAFMFIFARDYVVIDLDIHFVFSYTERESIEEKQPDGSVVKRAVFKFKKFIVL